MERAPEKAYRIGDRVRYRPVEGGVFLGTVVAFTRLKIGVDVDGFNPRYVLTIAQRLERIDGR